MQTPSLGRTLAVERAHADHLYCRQAAAPPALLINLDGSTDRLARMRVEFARAGIAFERFPAVNGTHLPPSVRPYFCDRAGNIVSPLRPGEIGCYASHVAVWQRVAEGRCGRAALVCEDDIGLPERMASLLGDLMRAAPSGWDVVRLSSETTRPVAIVAALEGGRSLVRYWRAPLLSGAYLVSFRGAVKLLRPGLRDRPVDQDLARPWLFNLDAYGVCPEPIVQPAAQSTIEGMGGREPLHWTRRSRRTDHAGRLAYNLKTMGLRQWLGCFAASRASRLRGVSECRTRVG